jgi:hypothetical protein
MCCSLFPVGLRDDVDGGLIPHWDFHLLHFPLFSSSARISQVDELLVLAFLNILTAVTLVLYQLITPSCSYQKTLASMMAGFWVRNNRALPAAPSTRASSQICPLDADIMILQAPVSLHVSFKVTNFHYPLSPSLREVMLL